MVKHIYAKKLFYLYQFFLVFFSKNDQDEYGKNKYFHNHSFSYIIFLYQIILVLLTMIHNTLHFQSKGHKVSLYPLFQ